jgi:acyl carrier protein
MASLEQGLREIIAEVIEKEPEEIGLDAHLLDDLGADSMMLLEIVYVLEENYHVTVPEEDVAKLTTLRRFVELVNSQGVQE